MDDLYFIENTATGFIKVGRSVRPSRRLAEMQAASAGELVLRALIPGGGSIEKDVHRAFASAVVRGEWFRPVPELLAFFEPFAIKEREGPKRRRGKDARNCVISVAVTKDEKEAIKALAAEQGVTVSELLRRLANAYVAEHAVQSKAA